MSVSQDDTVWVYLEGPSETGFAAAAIAFEANGRPLSSLTPILEGFETPFGEVAVGQSGMMIAVQRSAESPNLSELSTSGLADDQPTLESGDPGVSWELWRWTPAGLEQLLTCFYPSVLQGRILARHGDLYIFVEDPERGLLGHRTHVDEPSCLRLEGALVVLPAPLADEYGMGFIDESLVISELSGDTYVLHQRGRNLEHRRRIRLATGHAVALEQVTLSNSEDYGPAVLFGTIDAGRRDVYLAALDDVRVGPLDAARVVRSGDVELGAVLVQHPRRDLIQWWVMDGGEALALAAFLPVPGAAAVERGEVLWRHDISAAPLYQGVWTSAGYFRIWLRADPLGTELVSSPFRPDFFRLLE